MTALPAQSQSHRFRTHLAAVVSSVEVLLYYGASCPDEERAELLRGIAAAAQSMREMLDAAAQVHHA